MLAAYFCHSCYSQVEYNCELIKVDWLADCIAIRVVGAVLVAVLGIRDILVRIRIRIPVSVPLNNGSGSGSGSNSGSDSFLH